MASLFNIGVNGLRAQQAALSVTGQNITNASTPGYTRQRVDLVSQSGGVSAGQFSGGGARVDSVTRITDQFVNTQILTDTARNSELSAFSSELSQLEGVLFDDGFGIDSAVQDFFSALDTASANPLDGTLRQFVLDSGSALANRFQGVSDRLSQQNTEVVSALGAAVEQVNDLSFQIAAANERIANLQDEKDSSALNLMLDQRDELLRSLSGWVGISTSEQADGQLNVFVGKGQSLVLGESVSTLGIGVEGTVTMQPSGSNRSVDVTESIRGGELGGLLEYRSGALELTRNQLGHLAVSIAQAVNEQHALGIDPQGEFGGDFFRDVNDVGLASQRVAFLSQDSTSNVGTVNVYIDDPDASAPTDYVLRVGENGDVSITRRDNSAIVYQGANIAAPQTLEFDGIRVEFTSGTLQSGEALLLSPYGSGAAGLDLALNDTSRLALAAPVAFTANANNDGSAQLSLREVLDPNHPIFASDQALVPPLLVRFVTDTQFEILDNTDPASPQPLVPDAGLQEFVPGRENKIFPVDPGASVVSTSGPNVARLPDQPTASTSLAAGVNGYPGGSFTIEYSDPETGAILGSQNSLVTSNSSAQEIAEQLSALSGVNAHARTDLTLSGLVNFEDGVPVELTINGETLTDFATLAELADAINANESLRAANISAQSDGQTLQLTARNGQDLTLHFQGDPNESLEVSSRPGSSTLLNGSLPGNYEQVTVGGRVSAVLDSGVSIETELTGLFAANPATTRADYGVDLVLAGSVSSGDEFTVDFNATGSGDNRNALALSSLSQQSLVGDPPVTFARAFAGIVQTVGAASAQASSNASAAQALLDQSQSIRESISGVNLDEEAANLIRFEQAYNASAQIISVARDIFNVLLNSVG